MHGVTVKIRSSSNNTVLLLTKKIQRLTVWQTLINNHTDIVSKFLTNNPGHSFSRVRSHACNAYTLHGDKLVSGNAHELSHHWKLQLSKDWFASGILIVDEGLGNVPVVQLHQKITVVDMVQPLLCHRRPKPSFEHAKCAEGALGGTGTRWKCQGTVAAVFQPEETWCGLLEPCFSSKGGSLPRYCH